MSTAPPGPPTSDQLAGVYVRIEAEEKVTVRAPDRPRQERAPPDTPRPTADDLAGVYVCIEAEEKVTLSDRPAS